jgi:hypothetical protein
LEQSLAVYSFSGVIIGNVELETIYLSELGQQGNESNANNDQNHQAPIKAVISVRRVAAEFVNKLKLDIVVQGNRYGDGTPIIIFIECVRAFLLDMK